MTEPDDDPRKIADHMIDENRMKAYDTTPQSIKVMYVLSWFSMSGMVGLVASKVGVDTPSRLAIGVLVTLFVFSAGALLLNAVFDG